MSLTRNNESSEDEDVHVSEPRDGTDSTPPSDAALEILSWNIHGNTGAGMAENRHKVVSTTLKSLAASKGRELHYLLCIQENLLQYPGQQDKIETCILIHNQYDVIQVTEGVSGLHNQVIYSKSIFEVTSDFDEHLKKAYALMDYKKEIVDWIAEGGDIRKKEFHTTLQNGYILISCPASNDIKTFEANVIAELKAECHRIGYEKYREMFIRHDETVTKTACKLLKGRAAMVFLKTRCAPSTSTTPAIPTSSAKATPTSASAKAIPTCSTVATPTQPSASLLIISFHSFNLKRSPDRLTYLLFELVEKLVWFTADIPVLICGDFNEDIRACTSLKTFLSKYEVPEYTTVFREWLSHASISLSLPTQNHKHVQ